MCEAKPYFTVDDVREIRVPWNRSNTDPKTLPTTEIGREVLRNFVVDFDEVNQAFNCAMKRHFPSVRKN